MNEETLNDLAVILYYADKFKFQIHPITNYWPDFLESDGYAVQEKLKKKFLSEKYVFSGRKIGGFSYVEPSDNGFGPHYGNLWKHKVFTNGKILACETYLTPGIEAEIAVVISRDLYPGPVTTIMAESAIGYLLPAWEIVESRIIRKEKKMPDSLADNASFGGCVLGYAKKAANFRNKIITAAIYKNNIPLDCRTGAVCLSQLSESVAWLANCLIQQGKYIKKGELILTGALTKPLFPIRQGETFSAEFGELGEVLITGG